jgi:hypothetical protein
MVNMKTVIEKIREDDDLVGSLLKREQDSLTDPQSNCLDAILPLISVYIYCSPCVCLIHTALSICQKVLSRFVRVLIRPDDRLLSSCCVTADQAPGLRSILEWVRQWEARASFYDTNCLAEFLDTTWLERRLEHLEYEQLYDFREENTSEIIIIGEVDHLSPLLQKAPGRIPKAMDIWAFKNIYPGYSRRLFSRYIEINRGTGRAMEQLITSNPLESLQQDEGETARSKRPPSPMSLISERRKKSAVAGGSSEEIENEGEGGEEEGLYSATTVEDN